jgi:glycosyltransferase involved in cell wall biosynthesis
MRSSPRLSIGLPVYNGERYLAETLECFLAQTFADFEIIIGDNASTDLTAEICRSFARRDARIRYHRNETNLGAIPNYNKVFALARSPFFKWTADDDMYHPRYLEACFRILDDDRHVVLAHSRTKFVDDNGQEFDVDHSEGCYIDPRTGHRRKPDSPMVADSPLALVRFWQVLSGALWGTHMFGVMRRDVLQKTQLLPDFAGSDRAMLAELALLGRFRCSGKVLYAKRFHGKASFSLNQGELRGWLNTDGRSYSRRGRQLAAYFGTPRGKPIGPLQKGGCIALVAIHSARTAMQAIGGKDGHHAANVAAWRAEGGRKSPKGPARRHGAG